MKIIITGIPYFAKIIANKLRNFDQQNKYVFININRKNWPISIFKYLIEMINTDIIYRIGGINKKNYLFNFTLKMQKKIIIHWVGDDVLRAEENYFLTKNYEKYEKELIHFSEVEWIKDELEKINIKSKIVPFFVLDSSKNSAPTKLPNYFSILAYNGKNYEEFYHIDWLIKLANDFPNIEIKILGINSYKYILPNNIKLLGWVNNIVNEYQNCVLFLRLPKHDGLGFSVLEALSNGRYVGYTFPLKCTYYIDSYDTLKKLVIETYNKYKNNKLSVNYVGIRYVKQNYSEKNILNNLIDEFKKIVGNVCVE